MDIYVYYVLNLLKNSNLSEISVKKNLSKKFSLTDSYCDEIISKMVQNNLIESEFDEDFQNVYNITQAGESFLLTENDDLESENNEDIDYKSLLGDLCDKEKISNDDEEFCENDKDENVIENEITEQKEMNKEPYFRDFSQYKLNVKKHNKNLKYDSRSCDYLKANKLNFTISIILFLICIVILVISYSVLYVNNLIDKSISISFLLFACSIALYPIIMFFLYITNVNKKIKNLFNFMQSLKLVILCVSVSLILILAINFLFGLNMYNWLKFLPYWFFPIVVGIIAIFYPIVKIVLIKTKKFNA